jgi:pimeloyl-ACP methyl ester carboxylesterase
MSEPISFERAGRGRTVVVLHPLGLGPGPLRPMADRLSDHHDVVVPARRGYGPDEALTGPRDLEDHLDDLLTLLDALELESATFVGVSAGATLVLALAIEHPDVVDAGLAHEPLIGPLAPELHETVSEAIGQLLADGSPKAVAAFVADLIGVEAWNRLRPEWRAAVEAHADAALAEACAYPAFAPTPDALATLGGRGIVTSVGARSGRARHEAASVLSGLGLSCPVVAGARHLAPLEAPEEFLRLLDSLPHRSEVR